MSEIFLAFIAPYIVMMVVVLFLWLQDEVRDR